MAEPLRLEGCTPEPLMGYLKALGVLRLLDEQMPEAGVRGWWAGGVFCLLKGVLGEGQLVSFFLDKYRPTPLLAPWNGGSGFYVKLDLDRFFDSGGKEVSFKERDVVVAVTAVEDSTAARLERYRIQIKQTRAALSSLARPIDLAAVLAEPRQSYLTRCKGAAEPARKKAKEQAKKPATKLLNQILLFQTGQGVFGIGKADKDGLVARLRGSVLADDGIAWLDAALAMRTGQKKNRVEAPTLGSGGNIGNSDFSARFAQLLAEVIPFQDGGPRPGNTDVWLKSSLFGSPAPGLVSVSVDQFDPGRAGGANGTQGMEASPVMNPWDYILMLEGALALAGSPSRRLGAGRDAASFPFTVDSTSVGYGSAGNDSTRGELWLPLWDRPARFGEVRALLAEGRAEVGRRRAWSGLTFAQAVAGLGVDRGIREFVRFEFQQRFGDSYLATPVGRFNVPEAPRDGIELVRSLNEELRDLRFACRTKAEGAKTDPPARFPVALRRLDSAMFEFCKYGGRGRLAGVLRALGNAERELAVGDMPPDKRRVRRPLGGLSPEWLPSCDDGSAEYRLARSIASITTPAGRKVPPLRAYLEPVEWGGRRWLWSGDEQAKRSRSAPERPARAVVWSAGPLPGNLGAVLARRVIDAELAGEEVLPLASPLPVPLGDVSLFVAAQTDDARVEELLWGFALTDRQTGQAGYSPSQKPEFAEPLPRAYALLKLTLLPGRLGWAAAGDRVVLRQYRNPEREQGVAVVPQPAMIARLRAGDVAGACDLAGYGLRAAGFVPLPGPLADGSRRAAEPAAVPLSSERLLASLLFPIADDAIDVLGQMVLRRPPVGAIP
jgi:CRISPR-associated protein Csx17